MKWYRVEKGWYANERGDIVEYCSRRCGIRSREMGWYLWEYTQPEFRWQGPFRTMREARKNLDG